MVSLGSGLASEKTPTSAQISDALVKAEDWVMKRFTWLFFSLRSNHFKILVFLLKEPLSWEAEIENTGRAWCACVFYFCPTLQWVSVLAGAFEMLESGQERTCWERWEIPQSHSSSSTTERRFTSSETSGAPNWGGTCQRWVLYGQKDAANCKRGATDASENFCGSVTRPLVLCGWNYFSWLPNWQGC